MKPLYIFDLDGTLALTDHRQHILDDKDNPHRWQQFFAACVYDKPNWPVIRTMQKLLNHADIWIWSGRSNEVHQETVNWLKYTALMPDGVENILTMREARDYTPDDELKAAWLDAITFVDRQRLVAVFDDRDKVVAMWRSKGIACFQVAKGDF